MVKQLTTRELIFTPEEVKQKLGIPVDEETHNFQMWVDYRGLDCIETIRFVWRTEIEDGNGN